MSRIESIDLANDYSEALDFLAEEYCRVEFDSFEVNYDYLSAQYLVHIDETAERFGRSAKLVESDVFDCMAGKPVQYGA